LSRILEKQETYKVESEKRKSMLFNSQTNQQEASDDNTTPPPQPYGGDLPKKTSNNDVSLKTSKKIKTKTFARERNLNNKKFTSLKKNA
jgi:hypothetical protein